MNLLHSFAMHAMHTLKGLKWALPNTSAWEAERERESSTNAVNNKLGRLATFASLMCNFNNILHWARMFFKDKIQKIALQK